ncbi:hypothetical protein [Allocoleopsis franciscana]|nr:hypothetical protein [Allocoleopsis franciscana]
MHIATVDIYTVGAFFNGYPSQQGREDPFFISAWHCRVRLLLLGESIGA